MDLYFLPKVAKWRQPMKCFRHPEVDAVATCRYCSKGTCAQCAKDTEFGVVCTPHCEEEIKSREAALNKSKQAFPLASKFHIRNAVLLLLFAVAMIAYGISERSDLSMYLFFLSVGAIVVLGAIFSFLASRKYAKPVQTKT
jgi:hypothetical protein